jgi:hypothetical protein
MPSAAAMSELWRPSRTGRMVRLSLRASAGCGRPAALLRTPILRSRSAPSPRLSPRPGPRTDRGRRTAVARHTRPRAAASGWGPPIPEWCRYHRGAPGAAHLRPAALAARSKSAGRLGRRYAGRGSVRADQHAGPAQGAEPDKLRRTPGWRLVIPAQCLGRNPRPAVPQSERTAPR